MIRTSRGIARFNLKENSIPLIACDLDYAIMCKDGEAADVIVLEGKNKNEQLRWSQVEILSKMDRASNGRILCFIARTLTDESWHERSGFENIQFDRVISQDRDRERQGFFQLQRWNMDATTAKMLMAGYVPYERRIRIDDPIEIHFSVHES